MSPAESTLQFICDAYVCFCMHMYLSHLKVSYILLIITCAEKKNNQISKIQAITFSFVKEQ